MSKMVNFKKSLEKSIKAKKRTREKYEEMISDWTEAGLLEPEESFDLMQLLNEYYPVE